MQWINGIVATTANVDFTYHFTFDQPLASSNVWVFAQHVDYSNGFTVSVGQITTTGVDFICNARDTWGHSIVYMVMAHV